MATDDLRRTIERVGERFNLGEYEIEAYLTVLEHGQLTASGIADRTEIPQPRVYDTVRSLSDRGLVELRESRPMKISAIDPGEAFDDVRESLETMVDELESRYTAPARDTEAVTLIKSRSTILRYLEEVIDEAEFELTLSLTPALLERFEEQLTDAVGQDVTVDLLLAPASEAEPAGTFDYEAVADEVRTRRGITTPVVAVADGEYSIYATQDALREDQDRYGVIFDRSALGFLVSEFFGTVLWATYDEILLRDVGDRSLPRSYASIRRCVNDISGIEGDLYATVEGREVDTGRASIVRGRIVDVTFEETAEIANLTVAGDDGEVTVGGRVAAYEDLEAREIHVGRTEPPR